MKLYIAALLGFALAGTIDTTWPHLASGRPLGVGIFFVIVLAGFLWLLK